MSSSDSSEETYGITTRSGTKSPHPGSKKGKASGSKSKSTPEDKKETPITTENFESLMLEIESLKAQQDRTAKEVREILNIVKSLQNIMPRVASAGVQGHFNVNPVSGRPQNVFMP
ncbi:hypothetical protein [Lampyris noctiluca chuvirus-like virus 1]|uniref:Uncharacterized protein n=1 Tax=Lampyris noctiluca chuvirus-like virus 1 TaxID=2553070 RepID=A0A482JVF0_9VIRU|nr:hypothetical protein [Lampyris noctiluca chuvirus-like virus 1]